MYGFKVFVSTLILLVVLLLSWSFIKSEGQTGKAVSFFLLMVNALSLVAIWG